MRAPPETAMVFAAGFGTRMGRLTRDLPKPLLTAGGATLLDHALDHLAEAGVSRAVVNLHYRGEQIRQHLDGRESPTVTFSEEAPDILDTGGGCVQALAMLGPEAFVTLNADTVFLDANPISALVAAWDPDAADALMLLVPVSATIGYTRDGDFFLDEVARRPRRRGTAPRAPYVYAGAQIIKPGALADAPTGAFSLNVIWDRLLAEDRLLGAVYTGGWVDVGTPAGLELADQALRVRLP